MEMEPARGEGEDSPPSFRRFNLNRIPPRVQDTCFGKIRAFNTFTKLEWAYLVISLVALTASVGITIQRLTVEDPGSSDFTFAILLLLTTMFCYHYVIHSIFTERWDELAVFVASTIVVLTYCVVNFLMVGHPNTIKLVRLVLVGVFSPFLIVVGLIQSFRYIQSNNLILYSVGGIDSLQKSCRMYYLCGSLLKFDLQLQLSMLILVMGQGVLKMSLTQKLILGSGVPVTFLFFIIGFLGLSFENKTLMIIFYILGLFEPGYVAYKFYFAITYETNVDATYQATFVCGYFALVIWVLLIVSTIYFVVYHFGKGLKEKLHEVKPQEPERNLQYSSFVSQTVVSDAGEASNATTTTQAP